MKTGPRILIVDIETSPLIVYTWGLWDQNVALNQIVRDWNILSWSAKWLDDSKIFHADLRDQKDPKNDKPILQELWNLLDTADIVVTQNGKKFDIKKINTRLLIHGFKPYTDFKNIDTLEEVKKAFSFTSNKLAFLSDKVNDIYQKLEHARYPGQDLWTACLSGDQNAWKEMELYNNHDILATEELYKFIRPWMKNHPNPNLYTDSSEMICRCGSKRFIKKGLHPKQAIVVQRYKCKDCGAPAYGNKNMLIKEKI